MIKLKRLWILLLVLSTFLGAMPLESFAEEEDEEIPPVFHKDDDNDEVRIVIGRKRRR